LSNESGDLLIEGLHTFNYAVIVFSSAQDNSKKEEVTGTGKAL
jgi:hypothetical protein